MEQEEEDEEEMVCQHCDSPCWLKEDPCAMAEMKRRMEGEATVERDSLEAFFLRLLLLWPPRLWNSRCRAWPFRRGRIDATLFGLLVLADLQVELEFEIDLLLFIELDSGVESGLIIVSVAIVDLHLDRLPILGRVLHDAEAETETKRHGHRHKHYQRSDVAHVRLDSLRLPARLTNTYSTLAISCVFATLARLCKLLQRFVLCKLCGILAAYPKQVAG